MKNKVCLISCYFGKIPEYFNFFLKTCGENPDFEWKIFTDDDRKFNNPGNVNIIHSKLSDIEALIHKKIGAWAILPSAYKLCDYKVAYGLIFEDYLTGFTHWGYCDIDVAFGNLSKFITDDMLEKYDKIYPLGHLSIYKNNEECKRAFMLEAPNTSSYQNVYKTGNACYFDEARGINEKIVFSEMKLYKNIDFIDASSKYSRIRSVTAKETRILIGNCEAANSNYPINYFSQYFVWDNGRILKCNPDKDKQEEFVYLHFRRKLDICDLDSGVCFVIGKQKIFPFENEKSAKKSNNGALKDLFEYFSFIVDRVIYRKYAHYKDLSYAKSVLCLRKIGWMYRFLKKYHKD